MKRLLIFLLGSGVFLPCTLSGQSFRLYKAQLVAPTASGARVIVDETGRAGELIEALPAGDIGRTVSGYRVEIFSDNTSSARQRAYEAYARFRELCPEIPVTESRDIRYDSPKYTVRVGNFLTYEEALVLKGRLRNSFNAYVRNEQLSLSIFSK